MSILGDLQHWKHLYVSSPPLPAVVLVVDQLMWWHLQTTLPERTCPTFDQRNRLDDVPVYIDLDAPLMHYEIVDAAEYYARRRPAEES